MEQRKKDIGKIIEKRLQHTVEAPTSLKWERVSESLDKRKQRNRVLFFVWLSIGVIGLVVFGLLLHQSLNSNETHTVVEQSSLPVHVDNASSKTSVNSEFFEETEKSSNIRLDTLGTEIQTQQFSKESIEAQSDKEYAIDTSKEPNPSNNMIKTSKQEKVWVINTTQNDITKTFTVDSVTTYRYYNHDTQKELITTNKKKIDSLVGLSETVKDSID